MPFEVPEGWSWTSLNSVCTIFGRIGFRGYTKDDLVDSTGAITLSPSNIVDGVMNFGKCTYISWEKYEESPEIQVQNEDVLLVKTGSSYGKCAYVESLPKEATINPQFVVLKFIGCNPRFLTFCLQSNYARKQYEEFVLGTAIPTFTQVALGAMAIPMPPIEEQERIVTEVEKLLTIVDNIEQSKQDLSTAISQTKNRILDLAIHGKLVPQDANDEPASELLKRINPKAEITCDNGHYQNLPKGWAMCQLEDITNYEQPTAYIVDSTDYDNNYSIPVLTAGKSFIIGYTNETEGIYSNLPCIIFDDFTTDSKLVNFPFKVKSSAMKILQVRTGLEIEYVSMFMSVTRLIGDTHKRYWISEYSKLEIPIPPLAEQKRIVDAVHAAFAKLDAIMESL